jgi:hypothetical protein
MKPKGFRPRFSMSRHPGRAVITSTKRWAQREKEMSELTVQAAFEQFLADPKRKLITRSKYSYKLRPFLERCGELAVTAVTAGVVNSWFTEMEQRYCRCHAGHDPQLPGDVPEFLR